MKHFTSQSLKNEWILLQGPLTAGTIPLTVQLCSDGIIWKPLLSKPLTVTVTYTTELKHILALSTLIFLSANNIFDMMCLLWCDSQKLFILIGQVQFVNDIHFAWFLQNIIVILSLLAYTTFSVYYAATVTPVDYIYFSGPWGRFWVKYIKLTWHICEIYFLHIWNDHISRYVFHLFSGNRSILRLS